MFGNFLLFFTVDRATGHPVGKVTGGSCGQCRTVHEGFKPQSPCFLYGVNKNYACTGKGERGHNFALLISQRHVGDHTLLDVMQLFEVAKVSFQLETSS